MSYIFKNVAKCHWGEWTTRDQEALASRPTTDWFNSQHVKIPVSTQLIAICRLVWVLEYSVTRIWNGRLARKLHSAVENATICICLGPQTTARVCLAKRKRTTKFCSKILVRMGSMHINFVMAQWLYSQSVIIEYRSKNSES